MIDVDRLAEEFLKTKDLKTSTEKRLSELRSRIIEEVQRAGETDDKGNKWLPGHDHMTKYERRTSVSFDWDAAAQWLVDNDLWEDGTTVIPERREVDEDKVVDLLYKQGVDTSTFHRTKESWAVKVTREEQYEY